MIHFSNLPGPHNYQNRCKLERACEELRYYRKKVGVPIQEVENLIQEIETATPETAAELFSRARELCRGMEKILLK